MPLSPRVEPARRQMEEPQECSQRDAAAALLDGTEDLQLVGTIGPALARQLKARDAKEGQGEPEQRREFLDVSSESQDLLSKFELALGLSRPD